MSVWAELWTRPGDPNFGRIHDDIPFSSHGLNDGMGDVGDGSGLIPDSWDGFDDVIYLDPLIPANSKRSLVRLFHDDDPTEPFYEWLPKDLNPVPEKEAQSVEVVGPAIKAVMAEARLEAYDWDGSDDFTPDDPEWQWGAQAENLLRNPGFETESFPNGGAEDGNANYWQSTEDDTVFNAAQSITAINSPIDARSGDFYILVDPNGAMSGVRRSIGGLIVGETYTIVGYLREATASGDRYRAGVEGAVSASHANAYEADGIFWADLGNVASGAGASDGTWQQFTLTFVAAENQVALFIVYQDVNDFPFQLDDWSISGDNVGIDPWTAFAGGRGAVVNVARVSNAQSHSGSQSLEFQGIDGPYYGPFGHIGYGTIGLAQTLPGLTVGKTYTLEAWVFHTGVGNQRYKINLSRVTPRGPLQTTLVGTKIPGPGSYWLTFVEELVPPNTWTRLRITFVPDVAELILNVRWAGTDSRNVDVGTFVSPTSFFDDIAIYEGLPATTLGDIITKIYDHATDPNLRDPIVWDDGSGTDTPYLTLDFDAVLDSAGDAWVDDELTIRLYMRMRYDQILEQFSGMGYEWRVVPDDVEAGTWLLQVYNPEGMGTDYTAAGSPAIQGGSEDVRRQIRRSIPGGTELMVEGLGRATARARLPGLVTALGRIESGRIDRELPSMEAAVLAAAEDADDSLRSALPVGYTLVDPEEVPLVHYRLGDILTVHDPPDFDGDGRFLDVAVSFAPSRDDWDVNFLPGSVGS